MPRLSAIAVALFASAVATAASAAEVRTGHDLAGVCRLASQSAACDAAVRRELDGGDRGYADCLRGVSNETLRQAILKTAGKHPEILDDIAWTLAIYALAEQICSREYTEFADRATRALGEPLLSASPDPAVEIYRLVALPTFHLPIAIRVTVLPSGDAAATVRQSSHPRGARGPLLLDRAVNVAKEDVRALRSAVERTKFWTLIAEELKVSPATRIVAVPVCADGTSNYVEVVRGGRHHRVKRGCWMTPEFESLLEAFKRIGRPLLPDIDNYVP